MPGPKKAQRTKGNVKPSSSSQAAQLLAASGQAPTGFIGFSSQPAFVPASETFDDAESTLDDDFRFVLRKLSKRDSVTKVKALQEFIALCSSKDEECIKAVIPFWPRVYNKIAIDVDHKVRELSQKALATLAARAGKAIAPHLKSIMGLWLVSMCDTYPTVASAANTAFTSTFSAVKQTEAIRFCRAEITECLMSYILQHTSRTLSDPLTTSEEDIESKYQRVVSSSLQAFSKLLHMLPADSVRDSMLTDLTKLLENPVFWKHAKSTVPQIMCGALSLLSATCQLCPEASIKVISKVSPFIFSCLDATDPNVVSHTWEAVLSLINAHEECWQHINWQKAVWPKIKRVLESGCSGQATVICPCLLPLLSKIPNINFTQFFDSFRLGLRENIILNSPLDLSALVRSLLECIHYCVKCKYGTEENVLSDVRGLILDQVLMVVKASLTDSKPGLSKTDLYVRLCPLLSAAAKIDSSIEEAFWSDLSSFVRNRLLEEFMSVEKNVEEFGRNNNEPVIFQRIKLLFEGVVFQQSSVLAKAERVRFASEEVSYRNRKNNFGKAKQILSDSVDSFMSDIFIAVFQITSVKTDTAPLFFSLFKDLAVIHISNKTAQRLTSRSDHIGELVITELGIKPVLEFSNCAEDDSFVAESDETKTFRDFLCNYLMRLLLYAQGEENVNSSVKIQFTDDVIVTMFAFVACIDQEDGTKILFEFLNDLTDPVITCQFIEHLLDNVRFIPACRPLVAGTELAAKIETLTMSVSDGETFGRDGEMRNFNSTAVWKMLTSVVSSLDDSDNHLFSQSCLDAVVSSCLTTLQQLQPCDLSQRVDTVSSVVDLVLALFDKHKISMHLQLGDLVLSLLPLLLLSTQHNEEETQKKLKSSWLTGMRIILEKKSHVEIQHFVNHFCTVVKQWIQANVHTFESLLSVSKVVRLSLQCIASPSREVSDEDQPQEANGKPYKDGENEFDVETVSTALDSLLMMDSTELDCLKEVCEYLYICGSLESLPQLSQSDSTCQLPLQSYIIRVFHNLNILRLHIELPCSMNHQTELECHWSEAQLQTVAEMCHSFVLLGVAVKMKPQEFKEFPSALLTDLQVDLIKCVKKINAEQLPLLFDLAAQRSGRKHPAFTYSIKSVLELVSRSQTAEGVKVSPSITSALLSIRKSFLSRCLYSDKLVSEVSDLLGSSNVSGHSICEAFTLSCTVIMSCDDFKVGIIADCISGFLHLSKDYDVLKDEVKLSLFQQIIVVVKQLKEKNIDLLSGSNMAQTSADHIHLNISIIQALKLLVVPCNEQFWEFTLCALVEWIQFLSKAKLSQTSDAVTKALFVSTCELAFLAAHTLSTAPVAKETVPDSFSSFITEKAKTEWNEFFSEGVFAPLLPMFVKLASTSPVQNEPLWTVVVLPLAAAVSLCPGRLVLSHQLPVRLTTTDKSGMPDSLKSLFNSLCPLLMSRQSCVEIAAYRLLSSVVEEIPKHETTSEDEDKQEDELRSPPEALIELVETAGHFLECLKVVQVEDHIEMDRGTDEHAQAMGYLLAWRLLLQLFRCSPNQLRAKYAQYFKVNDLVTRLLDHLFRLLPQHPLPSMLEFTSEHNVQAGECETELSTLALHVYHQCLEVLPALVRTWWVSQDRKSSNFVDRFTTQYLSSSLIWQQLSSAQNTNNIDGITIRARPAAREVSATYEMAEVTVNMSITLPENYPLGKLEVACDKRVGVSQAQWNRWLLQLSIFLQHQNGSIVEGLRLWKGNIDKKFEGVEDCMICFSVIHGTTFQLPRLTCKTCRKKFHSACLYKWFSTAQKSSCPLCRNLF